MRVVINGKIYDTDTAEEIGRDSFGYSGDLNYWEEVLYRTKKGQFFLHGMGGANSRYRRATGTNEFSGGTSIRLLTKKEVLDWCEEHLIDASRIEAHFELEEG